MRRTLAFGCSLLLSFSLIVALCGSLASFFFQDVSPAAARSIAATAPGTPLQVNEPIDPAWQQVELILGAKCVKCHRPGTDLPDLTSYHAVRAGRTEVGEPLVVPGSPEASWLLEMATYYHPTQDDYKHRLEPEITSKNPEDWLTADQLASIEQWIRKGAWEHEITQ